MPAPNDYKVAAAGYTLSIVDVGTGHPERAGSLKLVDGKFAFEIHKGEPLTEELAQRVNARLESFYRSMRATN